MKPTTKIDKGITAMMAETLYPQESLMRIKQKNAKLTIGIPKELDSTEKRVCLTPEAVALLVNNGHIVSIESGAGTKANFLDREYNEAGARILYSHQEVFESNIILKVNPPDSEEIQYMKSGQTLISALQMAQLSSGYLDIMNKKRINAIAFEFIEDREGSKPVVKAMSEIAGSTAMLIAAEYLSSYNGMGVILGGVTGVPPTQVVILGAGTVAEYTARTAIGLGAEVKVFDQHLYRLRRLKEHLGMQLYTSTINTVSLRKELKEADVVIGSLRPEDGACIITEEMVAEMKPNSVIIDVSIDQGGCFETSTLTSHDNPVYRKYDVIHYCVPNIPSRVARTASTALSNIFTPILLKIADVGGVEEMIYAKKGFKNGVYSYKGCLTNILLSKRFNIPYKDIHLLLASQF
ncbi:MAG: pntA [Cytophagaceae bacterium]|jgi:alanine dehydrogenase|nr:pntA [Cytophagaceae bacterium]